MNIQKSVSLSTYSTMGLGGDADYLVSVGSRMELLEALSWAQKNKQPVIMIGGGSNIIWGDEGFRGLVIVNDIHRYEIFKEDDENTYITIGAGENWDKVVERTTNAGLSGIEALSLIPGTTGATLVQNVGAYGQEISQTLVVAEVFDTQAKDFIILGNTDCGFGYRTSRFKTVDKDRFYITAITLHLTSKPMEPPFYESLQKYLQDNNIKDYSPASIRKAVMAIRSSKLPDPKIVKNCGSFFANPVIFEEHFIEIKNKYPDIPNWPIGNNKIKIPAAWLIQTAGFKDFHDESTGMATWKNQSLVMVNEHAHSTADLLKFKSKIVDTIKDKFGITLEQEPEILVSP